MFMHNLLSNKRYVYMTLALLVAGAFLLVALLSLFSARNTSPNSAPPLTEELDKVSYTGYVTVIDPRLYPRDDIEYALTTFQKEEVVLLKGEDDSFRVTEGMYVTVAGRLAKTADGSKDVLIVKAGDISVKNDSN